MFPLLIAEEIDAPVKLRVCERDFLLARLLTVPGDRCRGTDGKFPLLSLWIFDPNVGKLPEILVERGDGSVFGSGRGGE